MVEIALALVIGLVSLNIYTLSGNSGPLMVAIGTTIFVFGGFAAAAWGRNHQVRAMAVAYLTAVICLLLSGANDPQGAVFGFVLLCIAGIMPTGAGAAAGAAIHRWRNGAPQAAFSVVLACLPAAALLILAWFAPSVLMPEIEL